MTTSTQHCVRCQRPAPPQESDEFLEWEAADSEGEQVVCPGCLTAAEETAMAEAMPGGDKIRENRLRRMAERQGLTLTKSRRRDPRARDYGKYWLADASTNALQTDERGLTLDEVEAYLNR